MKIFYPPESYNTLIQHKYRLIYSNIIIKDRIDSLAICSNFENNRKKFIDSHNFMLDRSRTIAERENLVKKHKPADLIRKEILDRVQHLFQKD